MMLMMVLSCYFYFERFVLPIILDLKINRFCQKFCNEISQTFKNDCHSKWKNKFILRFTILVRKLRWFQKLFVKM